MGNVFFDRDISWLSFNERVLDEAADQTLPLGERIKFLSIYSSNLDEFYRVRIPALMALHKIKKENALDGLLLEIDSIIDRQQQFFGKLLITLIPKLREKHQINLIYGKPIPEDLLERAEHYFFNQVMSFLQPVFLSKKSSFFPENNVGYKVVSLSDNGKKKLAIVNIPSRSLGRFFSCRSASCQYILFLDDIITANLSHLFPDMDINSCYNIKITRDADLGLADEYEGDLAKEIEKQLLKRDLGYATRMLYNEAMPEEELKMLVNALHLKKANLMPGGRYHNLKDLMNLPLKDQQSLYSKPWAPIDYPIRDSIFNEMEAGDFMLHTPYQSYHTVLRFFNEAALDHKVKEIFLTIYRMAGNSHIGEALISAAKNGKKVTVFVELKARFDEANNIRWAKRMKAAGVKIIYSIPGWKVHAKVALVKRQNKGRLKYYGLLGTGNFNENTAKLYTDHILFTTEKKMLRELELLFLFLGKRKKMVENQYHIEFERLLVAQFNLLPAFMELIDYEIEQAKQGNEAFIRAKLNNLEEERIIKKLYEASNVGVKIQLLVRSICRLVPGVKGQSENITIHRVVDRYLEHGRIFIFHHGGADLMFAGSADWMHRNVYRRIEVCFPIVNEKIRQQLKEVVRLGWADNVQGVKIDEHLNNLREKPGSPVIRSQQAIYAYFSGGQQ